MARFPQAIALYQNACVTCHGANLQGGIGPNLQHVGSQLSLAQIVTQINNGGGAMPGYGPKNQAILTNQQIDELATWLATKK